VKAGIIAAGLGERLRAGGIATPKPLVEIAGAPLISHVIRAARRGGASEVVCIINAETDLVRRYLATTDFGVPVEIVQKSTRSSADSFLSLSPWLRGAPFLLFTADTIFDPACLEGLVEAGTSPGADGVLALTTFVDDEKPLFAAVDQAWRVTALGDAAAPTRYVTAGIYFFSPLVYELFGVGDEGKFGAFRDLLQALSAKGFRFRGHLIAKAIDVDRPQDLTLAEDFLRSLKEGQ